MNQSIILQCFKRASLLNEKLTDKHTEYFRAGSHSKQFSMTRLVASNSYLFSSSFNIICDL